MKTVYEKNLDALKIRDLKLYKELSSVKENSRYEVFQDENQDNINILDTKENIKFYNNPLSDMKYEKENFEEYIEYDFLYIFGIGNGVVVKELLKNKKHQRIVVVEPNLELLYIALNLFDFSQDIMNRRLIYILGSDFLFSRALNVVNYKNSKLYARVFKLHAISKYYEHVYMQEMIKINETFIRALEYNITIAGNSTVDQVLGLKQHLSNIPRMIKGPKFSSFKKAKNSDIAIIVSTGPSLHKQLDLLEEIKDYVTIISVDASMPILEKRGIKPDFVASMERDEESDIFHKKTSQEFQKDINFVCASLQNKSVFNAIKNGTTTLVMRPFPYNAFFDLGDYGYTCSGMSSANMAYEMAIYMDYKKIVFIGQDLAYGKDGSSHSKDHVLGEDFIKDGKMNIATPRQYENIELEAYGGKGYVKSIHPWKLFLNGLTQTAEQYMDIVMSINATEGGARIGGTIEMPFKEVVDKYVDRTNKKSKIVLEKTNHEEFLSLKKECDIKIQTLIDSGEALQSEIEEAFVFISEKLQKIENKNEKDVLNIFSTTEMVEMLDKVNNLREKLASNDIFKDFYHDMLQSVLVNYELELSEIKVRKVTSRDENELKAIQWINGHRTWMFDLAGGIWNVLEILKNDYVMEPS